MSRGKSHYCHCEESSSLFCHSEDRALLGEGRRISLLIIIALAVSGVFGFAEPAEAANVSFSVEAWLKPESSVATKAILAKDNELRLVTDGNGKLSCQIHNGSAWQTAAVSDSAISLDIWQYVSCSYDGAQIKVFINAVEQGSQAMTSDVQNTTNSVYIGRDAGGTYGYFNGIIDDLKVYNYARSPGEIRLDYNAGFAARFGSVIASGAWQSHCSLDPASCMSLGLVASYDFDEGDGQTLYNAADTGSANDATLGSSSASDSADPKWTSVGGSRASASGGDPTSAAAGGALNFDGTDDYINCGNDSSLNITDAITIEAWVKLDATASSWQYIAGRDYTQWELAINPDNRIVFNKKSGAGYEGHVWSQIISKEVWHHIVLTFFLSSKTAHMYWDGSEVSSAFTYATGEIGNANTVIIGKRLSSQDYFNGSMDGVKIYNRALSAEEVRYHYNRGGPVAHWKFDEGSGQYARDAIGDADAQLGSDVISSGDTHDPVWGK